MSPLNNVWQSAQRRKFVASVTNVKLLSSVSQAKHVRPWRSVKSLHQVDCPPASPLYQIPTNAGGVKIANCWEERTPCAWSQEALGPASTPTNADPSAPSGRSATQGTDVFLLTLAAPTRAARKGSCASTTLQNLLQTLASQRMLDRAQRSGTSVAQMRIVRPRMQRKQFAKRRRKEESV